MVGHLKSGQQQQQQQQVSRLSDHDNLQLHSLHGDTSTRVLQSPQKQTSASLRHNAMACWNSSTKHPP
jgi:hypothetical protein